MSRNSQIPIYFRKIQNTNVTIIDTSNPVYNLNKNVLSNYSKLYWRPYSHKERRGRPVDFHWNLLLRTAESPT